MREKEFCYWLQGYFELLGDKAKLTKEQVDTIRQHLQLVFTNVSKDIDITKIPLQGPTRWVAEPLIGYREPSVTVTCGNENPIRLNAENSLDTTNKGFPPLEFPFIRPGTSC